MSEWEAAGEQAVSTAWELLDEMRDQMNRKGG
jgi:hypothetical protein